MYHVFSCKGGIMGKEDVEFVPLDDYTYEEAKRILKDVKKKKD